MPRWALASLSLLLLVAWAHFLASPRERAELAPRSEAPAAAASLPSPEEEAGTPTPPERDEVLSFVREAVYLLEEGDYYSAVGFLAFAHEARPDIVEICVVLAETYHQLNWTQEAAELLPCLRAASGTHRRALGLMARIERSVDFERGFELAASDHFVASYPGWSVRSEAVGGLLELLESMDELFDLRTLSGSFRSLPRQDVRLAYLQSYWMTHDLVEEDGWKSMRALLHGLDDDSHQGFEAAFANTYGESPGDYLERRYDRILPPE